MSFFAPMAFWFAAAIPIVVLFYLLKRKRVVQLTSSTLLWQRFLSETQASAPFQRLRHNWLLLLQLLLLLLIILALARPFFSGRTEAGRLHVVILDASASMQSKDVAPSRFEKARAEALELVETLHARDQMVLLLAGAHAEVRQSPTSEKSVLRQALQQAQVADTPTELGEALKLAETLVRNNSKAEIHLFSDGAVPALNEFENKSLPLVFHRIGEKHNNAGIVTLDVRPNPENPTQRAVFTSVANFSTNIHQSNLEFLFNGQVQQVKSVTVRPGETAPMVFVADQAEDGVFTVRLNLEDDLAADNEASVVSVLPQPVRVRLVTPGNNILTKALRAVPQVQLTVASTVVPSNDRYDLTVLDGVQPVLWPEENLLAFHIVSTNWFDQWETLEGPPIVYTKGAHPLLRFVSFDDVLLAESIGVRAPPWSVSLVDAPQSSLAFAGELGRQRIIWIGFDITQSTWPLRFSFPIFLQNAVDWLNPATANASQLLVQAGKPFRIGLVQDLKSVQITMPDGSKRDWAVNEAKGELVFGDTYKNGVYQVDAGTNQFIFCVNLLDSRESNTAPKNEITMGEYQQVSATTLRRANVEVWRWFVVVGLLVLLFEWWFYHKRTA